MPSVKMLFKLIVVVMLAFAVSALMSRGRTPTIMGLQSGKYYVSAVQMNFSQAFAACKRSGYTLASEETPEDTQAINAALEEVGATAYAHFIGGFRQVGGLFYPSWIWLDSGKEFGYSYWEFGHEATEHECVVKHSINYFSGNWTSVDCTREFYFICES